MVGRGGVDGGEEGEGDEEMIIACACGVGGLGRRRLWIVCVETL